MVQKFFFYFKFLIKGNFNTRIKHKKIIIFDDESLTNKLFKDLANLDHVFILKTRLSKIETVFINLNLIFRFFFFLIKCYNIQVAYFASIITLINPKIVLTNIDNCLIFSQVSKLLYKKIAFLAVQNAARYQFEEPFFDKKIIKKFFIPELACFGKHEEESYKKNNIHVKKFLTSGSLKLSDYLEQKKDTKSKEKYDICLILEESSGWDNLFPGFENAMGLIASHTARLAREENLSLVIAGKRNNNFEKDREKNFYSKYIPGDFSIKKSDLFSSYHLIEQSKITIGMMSTILREGLALEKKILSCNFSGCTAWNFPLKGICFLNTPEYDVFSKRVKKIISLDFKNYKKLLSKDPKYLMLIDKNNLPTKKIQIRIDELIGK